MALNEDLVGQSETYYTARFLEHGATPAGVDWNSVESQERRFTQLLRITEGAQEYSILDFGCGYGALASFLETRSLLSDYRGFDVSSPMLEHARAEHDSARTRFTSAREEVEPADFVVSSGLFNVKLDADEARWEAYVLDVLDTLDGLARNGFAFNMLTSYSDLERRRSDLYYADPRVYFDVAKRRYATNVAVLHDYGLYEFTVLVRKELP